MTLLEVMSQDRFHTPAQLAELTGQTVSRVKWALPVLAYKGHIAQSTKDDDGEPAWCLTDKGLDERERQLEVAA
jgi:hypothetical protein